MSLTITIPDTFSGPLDLLLYLIRRDEMDIEDINIGRLATSYLEELDRLEIVDVDEGAEFLDLASRLLEIKSRMLAPPEEEAREDDVEADEDFDPRSDLVAALLEYRKFKDAARMLGDLAEEQARRFPRVAPRIEFSLDGAAPTADSHDLMRAFHNLIIRLIPAENSNLIAEDKVPTHVRIEQIETVLAQIESTRFSKLLSGAPDRDEMVGFFIAILELVRLGRIVARQSKDFSDIILERREAPAPDALQLLLRRLRPTRCFLDLPPRREIEAEPKRPPFPFPLPAPTRRTGGGRGKKFLVAAFP